MDFVSHLKAQVDIVKVVGEYVRLKRLGASASYRGLCPFHAEKTPSFNVHSVHQFYKCFGCQAGGDVIKFVMEIEGLTFPEALQSLAERFGIPMPQRTRPDDPAVALRDALYEMHVIAAETFAANLRGAAGAQARRYLAERGVGPEMIEEFSLGYADPSGQQLTAKLQRFGPKAMEASGLILKRQESSNHYDRFRGRLMFPIHNESGKVIAFGGRTLNPDDQPKYLNSPETEIYKKSYVLYNLHRARKPAQQLKRMILVEGYMDVIGVYSAGVKEVVASCGTALTNQQVRSIKRHSDHIVVNFDSDEAGGRATEQRIEMLLEEGLKVRVLELPEHLDPDEYVKKYGAGEYQARAHSAATYFHWLADRARTKFDMRSAEGRMEAFQFLLPSLQKVSAKIERAAIANEIAEYLQIDPNLIRDQLLRQTSQDRTNNKRPDPTSALPPNEKLLLTCLLASEKVRQAVLPHLRTSGMLALFETRPILEVMLASHEANEGFSFDVFESKLETRYQTILSHLMLSENNISAEEAEQQALKSLYALEAKRVHVEKADLRKKIRELERNGKLTEALALSEELNRRDRDWRGENPGMPA